MALPAEPQKGLALPAALRQIKAMPPGRGNPFPASGPFAPVDRGKRAEKATCHLLMHRHRPLHPGGPGGARCLHPLHHAPSALRVFFELPPPCQRSRVFALQGKQLPVFLKHGVPSLTRHVIRLLARWVSRPRLGHKNPHFRSSSISCCSPFSTLLYPLHSILRVLFATTWTIIPPFFVRPRCTQHT